MPLEIVSSGQACGATVYGLDLSAPVDATTIAELRSAWLTHKVLAIAGQHMSVDDLERFTLAFGPFGEDPFIAAIDGHPHVIALHRRADETASVFAEAWHSDWSFQATPPDGTCLYGAVVPPMGGDTLFADQVQALAAMPLSLRERIEGLTAVHSARAAYSPDGIYGRADDASGRATRIVYGEEANETQTHPLVTRHHETGLDAIFGCVGYICGIEGMAPDEATELLLELYRWQTREEFRYRHRWSPGMLVMWDNRSVLHMATGGYDGHERLMYRTTIGCAHRAS